MGKMETLPPVKSEFLNRLAHNLLGLITSIRGTFIPNLVNIHSRGLLDKWVKYLTFLFIYISSWNSVENRPLDGFWRIRRRIVQRCAFLGYKWKIEIWPLFSPNPKNFVQNRQFPAKIMKHQGPNISESTKPIKIKI